MVHRVRILWMIANEIRFKVYGRNYFSVVCSNILFLFAPFFSIYPAYYTGWHQSASITCPSGGF
jgi:hypothetical protein